MKGKEKMSKMFQELKEGDRVAIIIEPSESFSFPKRLQGKAGIVEGKRGKAYIVKIIEGSKGKKFIVKSIHLKKLG